MPAIKDPPDDPLPSDTELGSSASRRKKKADFRSELIRATEPAIYGRSWIPYLRLLILLIVISITVIAVRGLFP